MYMENFITLQMVSFIPPHFPKVLGQTLWTGLEIEYHKEICEGRWSFNADGNMLTYISRVTTFKCFDHTYVTFYGRVCVIQELPFHNIKDFHYVFNLDRMSDNEVRRHVNGTGHSYY